ncbi:MAG: hypothetical protein WCP73_02415 [Eubacteriales bacterium]
MKSLTFAIIAIVLEILCYVIPAAGVIFGIAALVFAIIAYVTGKNILKTNPADGKAKAGKIIGLIFIILSIIGIVIAVIALATLAFAFGALGALAS